MEQPRTIKKGIEEESAYCRECKFEAFNSPTAAARNHSRKTGHTLDVYREHRFEITYWEDGKREWKT